MNLHAIKTSHFSFIEMGAGVVLIFLFSCPRTQLFTSTETNNQQFLGLSERKGTSSQLCFFVFFVLFIFFSFFLSLVSFFLSVCLFVFLCYFRFSRFHLSFLLSWVTFSETFLLVFLGMSIYLFYGLRNSVEGRRGAPADVNHWT